MIRVDRNRDLQRFYHRQQNASTAKLLVFLSAYLPQEQKISYLEMQILILFGNLSRSDVAMRKKSPAPPVSTFKWLSVVLGLVAAAEFIVILEIQAELGEAKSSAAYYREENVRGTQQYLSLKNRYNVLEQNYLSKFPSTSDFPAKPGEARLVDLKKSLKALQPGTPGH